MGWYQDLLTAALKSCPKGGREPEVYWPEPDKLLRLEDMIEQLTETVQRERAAVESAFDQWTSTNRWPRSTRYSGWLIRTILEEVRSLRVAEKCDREHPCDTGGASEKARVLKGWCGAWYEHCLPEWVEITATETHKLQELIWRHD